MKILFPVLAVLGGITIAVQGQINGGLGKKVGVIEASFISFGIGTLALLFIVLFAGQYFIHSDCAQMAIVGWRIGSVLRHCNSPGRTPDWSGACNGWGYCRPSTDWGRH
ncbi:hypothetical protein SRABI96_00695 [Peribacillus sp. Bi96]|nr:hypothetical protein SRABI96_00695 [Peribacillus sp. Bi96]